MTRKTASNTAAGRPGTSAITALLICAMSAGASAATPLKVQVLIERSVGDQGKESTLEKFWGADVPQIEQRSAQLVATSIGQMFRNWDFAANPARNYATLRLRLVEFDAASKSVYLQAQRYLGDQAAQADELWRIEWVHPGDVPLGNVPPREEAAQRIAATISSLPMDKKQLILNWLRDVPIGSGGEWVKDPAPPSLADVRLAAALPRDRFTELTNAKLLVKCKAPTPATASLELMMKGTSDIQNLGPPSGAISALVLRPEVNGSATLEVAQLLGYTVGVIYLVDSGTATNEDFFNVQ